jgi:hypothetical protein
MYQIQIEYEFPTSAMGWQPIYGDVNTYLNWQSTGGWYGSADTGCLSILESGTANPNQPVMSGPWMGGGVGVTAITSAWMVSGTWESFGVPAGAVVTSIQIQSVEEKLAQYAGPTCLIGPHILDSGFSDGGGRTQIATLMASRQPTGVESTWTSRSGTATAIPSGYTASSTSIGVLLQASLTPSTSQVLFDHVTLTIVYDPSGIVRHGVLSTTRNHATISGVGINHVPQFHGSSLVIHDHSKIASVAHFAKPIYHGSETSSHHPTLTGSASRLIPIYHGESSLSHHSTIMAWGIDHTSHGSCSLVHNHSGLMGEASVATPFPTAAGSLAHHPSIFAIATSPAPIYSAVAAMTSDHPTIAGLGIERYLYIGSVAVSVDHPSLSGMGMAGGPLSALATMAISGSTNASWVAALPLAMPSVSPGPCSGAIVLATSGAFPGTGLVGRMNLSMQATYTRIAQRATLSIDGSNGTAWSGDTTLACTGVMGASDAALNCVCPGQPVPGGTSTVMGLQIVGSYPMACGSITLATSSPPPPEASRMASLAIVGTGLMAGAVPAEATIGLVISKGPEAGITLFCSQHDVNLEATLAISGIPVVLAIANLAIEGTGGSTSLSFPLAIPSVMGPGWVNGTVQLAIPRTTGVIPATTTTFVRGWPGLD